MRNLCSFLLCFILNITVIMAQIHKVSGVVVSAEDNEPIIGATVSCKGTSQGTVTDFKGRFSMELKSPTKTLVISYVGMKTQEVAVKTLLRVVMEPLTEELEEVMVIAYGKARKSTFTGAAETVKGKDIQKRIVSNVTKAIEGTVSGIQIVSGGGQPGDGSNIIIHGQGSINASSTPLYVLDGIPYDGTLSAINPGDIESISVLKDASASALYGSRGANGVIMITTKKGKSGKPTVSLNASVGITSRAFPLYDRVNREEYMEVAWESVKNYALDNGDFTDAEAGEYALNKYMNFLGGESYNPFTLPSNQLIDPTTGKFNPEAKLKYADDWYKEGERKNPIRQEYLLSISGGTKATNYLFSLGYLNEKGLAINTGFERYSGRVNVDTQIKNWLKGGLSSAFSSTNQDYILDIGGSNYYNIWYSSMMIAPIYGVYKHDDQGNILHDDEGNKVYEYGTNRPNFPNMNWIAALLSDKRQRQNDNLSARTYFEIGDKNNESIGFLKDLKLTVNFGTDYRNYGNLEYLNPDEGDGKVVNGVSYRKNVRMLSYTFNQLLTYDKSIGDHSFDFLIGHEAYDYNALAIDVQRQGFYKSGIYELNSAAQLTAGGSVQDKYKIESVLSRLNYNYSDRYYLSGSWRTDGSSRFYKDNRWGQFWSAGLAWRISQEKFMENTHSWLENLTLKASIGEQGNDDLINPDHDSDYYAWMGLVDMNYANANMPGGMLYSLQNKDLKWEKNRNMNVGIESQLFSGRMRLSFDYYIKKTSDLLLNMPKAISTGFQSYYENVGNMKNTGFDINVEGDLFAHKDFTWNMGVILGSYKNKITHLYEGSNGQIILGSRILKEGQPINSYYLAQFAGVNKEDGNMQYYTYDKDNNLKKDDDGNPVLTEDYYEATGSNRQICGSHIPDFNGSWTNSFRYKQFDLSILCTYSVGGKVLDSNYAQLFSTRSLGGAWHKDILKRWQKPGDETSVARVVMSNDDQVASDLYLKSASFFALKNITLGYSLPNSWMKQAGMHSCRFYVTGDNLFLVTALKGMDPQYNFRGDQDYTYTPIRNITVGVNVQF